MTDSCHKPHYDYNNCVDITFSEPAFIKITNGEKTAHIFPGCGDYLTFYSAKNHKRKVYIRALKGLSADEEMILEVTDFDESKDVGTAVDWIYHRYGLSCLAFSSTGLKECIDEAVDRWSNEASKYRGYAVIFRPI